MTARRRRHRARPVRPAEPQRSRCSGSHMLFREGDGTVRRRRWFVSTRPTEACPACSVTAWPARPWARGLQCRLSSALRRPGSAGSPRSRTIQWCHIAIPIARPRLPGPEALGWPPRRPGRPRGYRPERDEALAASGEDRGQFGMNLLREQEGPSVVALGRLDVDPHCRVPGQGRRYRKDSALG
jgi:hypothetical protein